MSKKYFNPKSIKWEWLPDKPKKKLFTEEFMLMRPQIRREA